MIAVRAGELEHERRPCVVVTHSGRQYASEAVRAAQDVGLLLAFATGVHFSGGDPASRSFRYLAARKPKGLLRSVYGRTYSAIDGERIVAFPSYPLAGRLVRPLPGGPDLERSLIGRWGNSVGRWLERLPEAPRVVHSFEGQALEIFRAARRIGATTILDVNNAFEYATAELGREGIRAPSAAHAQRVGDERALADYFLAPSDYVRDCLVENGVPADRVVKIPLGTSAGDVASARRDHGGRTRVLFVGHVGARKGMKYLLEAWRRGIPNAELLVVGGADSVGRELLRDAPDGVTHIGYVSWPNLQHQFNRSDVFVFPSLAEGSALVNYQAMSTGLPVVTTPNAGSVVRDGIDGFVVPARDVDALTNRLRTICEDPELRHRLGASAAERIASSFTWDHYRGRVAAVYEALASGRPAPRELA